MDTTLAVALQRSGQTVDTFTLLMHEPGVEPGSAKSAATGDVRARIQPPTACESWFGFCVRHDRCPLVASTFNTS
jgi:hypothetical protein